MYLPRELWFKIMQYCELNPRQLFVFALVCREWNTLTFQCLTEISHNGFGKATSFVKSVQKMTNLTSLEFGCREGAKLLRVNIPNLVNLSLIGKGRAMPVLHYGISSFTHLVTLKLDNFILQDTLVIRFSTFTNLRSLSLSNVQSNNLLLPVVARLSNLTFLDVKKACESNPDLTNQSSQLINLTELHLSGINLPPGMLESISNLTILDLAGNNDVGDLKPLFKESHVVFRVTKNQISSIPAEISVLKRLLDLDLSLNNLSVNGSRNPLRSV
eukprot:TRINITY_DN24380_c0_g1_i1.p1 TRINITY_DN24380_c0_g1~~TRINITY_DN24380_c0_g1_i1.p1  ORF type:complete len:290 (-),score=42.47 TRINITY_DN24380_c0_g1_i1:111-926(-)